jgi:predicted ATP-grasp superfamily ATP-dependent carboligase
MPTDTIAAPVPAASQHTPIAVVAEVGWVNGLGAVRALGRRGVRVIAVDHRPWALGFSSRYAAEHVIAPDPVADEDGFIASLAELGARLDGPVPVFATHDEHVNAVVRRADEIGPAYRLPWPDWPTLEAIQSKRHQLEAAMACGVPVPETRHPRSAAEAVAAAGELGYPVFLKPSDPIQFKRIYRRQAFRCGTAAEVETAYGHMEAFEPMLQEFVPGGDDGLYTLGSYLADDGTALGIFCGRKLRQTREHMGSCRVGESVWVDRVVDDGLRILRHLGFRGVSQVEFKLDPRTGEYKLIEVNPRLWQWHSLSGACGADLTHIAYLDLVGTPPPPQRMTVEHRRWAITLMSGTRNGFQLPPYTDGVFALDDPRPPATQLVRLVRKGVHRPVRAWFQKSRYIT